MTEQVVERCMWSESGANDRGIHGCSEPAFFSVPVEFETDDGKQTGRVPLCTTHALVASQEGIAKP